VPERRSDAFRQKNSTGCWAKILRA